MTSKTSLYSRVIIILVLSAFTLSSCSSRRKQVSNTKAAGMAEAMSHLKNKDLYRFITDWTGVKYRLGGLNKKGIDCSGFALLLQRDIYGASLPRRSRDQADAVKERKVTQLKEGDLIFFSFGGQVVDHVGIYLNNDYFVHASTSRGVIVDDLKLPVYQKAIVKAGSIED